MINTAPKPPAGVFPKNLLFLLALFFGASGIYLGMQAPLYHKAAKPLFRYGIPLLILANVAALYLAWRRLF